MGRFDCMWFCHFLRLGTDHLTCRGGGGGYGFFFRSEICFRTTQALEYLIIFPAGS